MSPLSFELIDAIRSRSWAAPDTEQAKDYLRNTINASSRNPLLHQYISHLKTVRRNTLPWHALGERLYWMMIATNPNIKWTDGAGVGGDEPSILAAYYCAAMSTAQVYLLRNNAYNLAQAMPDLPRHVISRKCLQFPTMFFSREATTKGVGPTGIELESNAMLLADVGEGISVLTDTCQGGDKDPTMIYGTIQYGKTYPDDFSGLQREAVGGVLKLLAFLASTVASVSTERMGRGERRRGQVAGLPRQEYDRTVSVISLRAAEEVRPDGDIKDEAEWRHHWWVRGHWRAQWFPSEQAHHPVWIAPYVKGDLEKPLLEKVYHVNR